MLRCVAILVPLRMGSEWLFTKSTKKSHAIVRYLTRSYDILRDLTQIPAYIPAYIPRDIRVKSAYIPA